MNGSIAPSACLASTINVRRSTLQILVVALSLLFTSEVAALRVMAAALVLQYPIPQGSYLPGSYAGRSFYYDGVHLGEDIMLPEGTAVRAIADGRIVQYEYHSGYATSSDGTSIAAVIEHDFGNAITMDLSVGHEKTAAFSKITSIYGHIRKSQTYGGPRLEWNVDDWVQKGDIIGYVNDDLHNGDGSEHLHMGIRLSGHPGYWVYYGYENASIPESDVVFFGAASELIGALSQCALNVGEGTVGVENAAFQAAHSAAGGQSVLGCATNTVQTDGFTSYSGTQSHYQNFDIGTIEYLASGPSDRPIGQAFAIVNPLFSKWSSLGFNASNPLGYPIADLSSQSTSCYGTSLEFQRFEGGALEHHRSGPRAGQVFEVHGAIYTKWGAKGFAGCPLGLPISDERDAVPSGATGKTGRVSDFEGNSQPTPGAHIHWWTGAAEAYETHGPIDLLYAGMGGTASWLGFPTSDQYVASTGRPRSDFEGGYITTTDGVNYQAFSYSAPQSQLAVSRVGTGSGRVTSNPGGIDCGADCVEAYANGTAVTLTPTAFTGSVFSGWSGDADCADGVVTMNANKSCAATFNELTVYRTLTVTKNGTGAGTVTSSPAGITCGADCFEEYANGTVVTLTPIASSGSVFSGWSGDADCADGVVTMNANKSCAATFNAVVPPAGYYVLDRFGGVHPGGGAPVFSPATPYFGFDVAQDLEVASSSCYVLDRYGGVHPGGEAPVFSPSTPYWGWDVAQDLELADTGYYVLDRYGGVHPGGGAPVFSPSTPYWGWDVAQDLELAGTGYYVLDRLGGVHAGGGAPALSPSTPYWGFDAGQDLELR